MPEPEPTPAPARHVFSRLINAPGNEEIAPQQFMLRLCHEPYLANLPPEAAQGHAKWRAVTIDTELARPGNVPLARRAVLEILEMPDELFGAPLLAVFCWQDCAAFNWIWEGVEARQVDPRAVEAARLELIDHLYARLRVGWPEAFA